MGDYVAASGGSALGARLRRLSAAIDADAARVYRSLDIRFEQRWFGTLDQLERVGPLSVRDLSVLLGISHVSVSEARRSLEAAGLIVSQVDPSDARRRVLTLSTDGRILASRLRPLWDAFEAAARELDTEAGAVTEALDRLERALARKPLFQRVQELTEQFGRADEATTG